MATTCLELNELPRFLFGRDVSRTTESNGRDRTEILRWLISHLYGASGSNAAIGIEKEADRPTGYKRLAAMMKKIGCSPFEADKKFKLPQGGAVVVTSQDLLASEKYHQGISAEEHDDAVEAWFLISETPSITSFLARAPSLLGCQLCRDKLQFSDALLFNVAEQMTRLLHGFCRSPEDNKKFGCLLDGGELENADQRLKKYNWAGSPRQQWQYVSRRDFLEQYVGVTPDQYAEYESSPDDGSAVLVHLPLLSYAVLRDGVIKYYSAEQFCHTIQYFLKHSIKGCKSKIWLRAELVDIEFRTQFEAQFRLEADAATVKPTEPIQVKIEERTVKSDSQESTADSEAAPWHNSTVYGAGEENETVLASPEVDLVFPNGISSSRSISYVCGMTALQLDETLADIQESQHGNDGREPVPLSSLIVPPEFDTRYPTENEVAVATTVILAQPDPVTAAYRWICARVYGNAMKLPIDRRNPADKFVNQLMFENFISSVDRITASKKLFDLDVLLQNEKKSSGRR